MHDWIDKYVETKSNEHTRSAYRADLAQLVKFLGAWNHPGVPAASNWAGIRPEHLQEYRFFLRDRGYQDTTLARKMAVLRTFLNFLAANGVVTADQIGDLPPQTVEASTPKHLSESEVVRLLDAANQPEAANRRRDCAVLTIVYYTGLRASDVTKLNVDDVGPRGASLHLPDGTVKALAEEPAQAVLHHMQTNHASLYGPDTDSWTSPANADGPVPLFPNRQGTRMTRQGVWSILKSCLDRSDLDLSINLQMLRNTHFRHNP